MIGRFKINAKEHEWFFYLDNKSMIQRLEGYSQIYTPKWNLRPDEDITKLAHKLLHTIPHQFTHVKSHQDNIKNDKKLPFPAVMNIMADQLASRQRNLMTKPDSTVTNLATAQLRIKDVCITRDSQKWLLHSAGKIPIQSYYQEKFGWTETVFDNIAWDVQQAALKSFPVADQTRLLKFVHGWLPTASRLFKEGTATSKRCPICQAPREDNLHLLHCTNKDMERIQEKIQLALVKDMHDHGDSELSNIIKISILNAGVIPDWTPTIAHVSRKWKAAVRDQTKIGWMHLIHGRFSKTLIQAVNQHYESQEISAYLYNGTRWAKKIITAIWTIILELWEKRNNLVYNKNSSAAEAQNKAKLEMRIRRCYEQKSLLKAHERNCWFTKTLEEKLQEDHKQAQNWLQGIERLIKISKREQLKRPRESIIMERFIKAKTLGNEPDHTQHAVENPRAFSQELNPD
jgi:hypothetical protein